MNPDIFRKRGEYYLDSALGSVLNEAVEEARKASPALGHPIMVIFNGTVVKVDGKTDMDAAYNAWNETRTALQQQADDYKGDRQEFWAKHKQAEQALDQQTIDKLAGGALDNAIKAGPRALMEWMKDYTGTINCELDNRGPAILKKLADAGYARCEREDDPYGNEAALGRYIVGRMMDNIADNDVLPRWEIYPLCDRYSDICASHGIGVRKPLTLNGRAPVPDVIPVLKTLKIKSP